MKSKIPHARRCPATHWMALCLAVASASALAQQSAQVEALEAAVRRGEVQAMVTLAGKYERGEDVERDFVKSNELYCKAAARGDAGALLRMGQIYSAGRVVRADEGTAALLIRKAAEQGNEHAKGLLDYVSRRTGSVLPACLDEPVEPAASATRKEIEQLVQYWAPSYAIDPDLVMALIAVESRFDAGAVSPKNAQGLMQLIPATARRFGVKNAYNPLDNLKGGLAYLRWLMAYFKGDVALVLAAYNAGEETVERYRGIPPYPETRNYVRLITGVYKKARHPYVTEIVAPSPVLDRIKRPE